MQVLRRESAIEARFVRLAKARGYRVIKLNLQGNRGLPDRLVLLPHGRAVFVELKRPGFALGPLQQHTRMLLRELGYPTEWFVDADEAITWVESFDPARCGSAGLMPYPFEEAR